MRHDVADGPQRSIDVRRVQVTTDEHDVSPPVESRIRDHRSVNVRQHADVGVGLDLREQLAFDLRHDQRHVRRTHDGPFLDPHQSGAVEHRRIVLDSRLAMQPQTMQVDGVVHQRCLRRVPIDVVEVVPRRVGPTQQHEPKATTRLLQEPPLLCRALEHCDAPTLELPAVRLDGDVLADGVVHGQPEREHLVQKGVHSTGAGVTVGSRDHRLDHECHSGRRPVGGLPDVGRDSSVARVPGGRGATCARRRPGSPLGTA